MKSEFLSTLLMLALAAFMISETVSQISPTPPIPVMSGANAI